MEENSSKKKKRIIIGTVIGAGVLITIIAFIGFKIMIERLANSTLADTVKGLMNLDKNTVEDISSDIINDIRTNKHDNNITEEDIKNEINDLLDEIKEYSDNEYTSEQYNKLFNEMYGKIKQEIDNNSNLLGN